MPRYEFECNQCKEKFETVLSVKDKESADIACSKCGSRDISQIYSNIYINIKKHSKAETGGCGNDPGCSGCCMRKD
jgi:putative FmdB family regulatory protein